MIRITFFLNRTPFILLCCFNMHPIFLINLNFSETCFFIKNGDILTGMLVFALLFFIFSFHFFFGRSSERRLHIEGDKSKGVHMR